MRLALLCLAVIAVPALAADGDDDTPRRTEVTVYGDDPCPTGTEGEIIVCAREPEEERYRIPKKLREKPVDEAAPALSPDVVLLTEIRDLLKNQKS